MRPSGWWSRLGGTELRGFVWVRGTFLTSGLGFQSGFQMRRKKNDLHTHVIEVHPAALCIEPEWYNVPASNRRSVMNGFKGRNRLLTTEGQFAPETKWHSSWNKWTNWVGPASSDYAFEIGHCRKYSKNCISIPAVICCTLNSQFTQIEGLLLSCLFD